MEHEGQISLLQGGGDKGIGEYEDMEIRGYGVEHEGQMSLLQGGGRPAERDREGGGIRLCL